MLRRWMAMLFRAAICNSHWVKQHEDARCDVLFFALFQWNWIINESKPEVIIEYVNSAAALDDENWGEYFHVNAPHQFGACVNTVDWFRNRFSPIAHLLCEYKAREINHMNANWWTRRTHQLKSHWAPSDLIGLWLSGGRWFCWWPWRNRWLWKSKIQTINRIHSPTQLTAVKWHYLTANEKQTLRACIVFAQTTWAMKWCDEKATFIIHKINTAFLIKHFRDRFCSGRYCRPIVRTVQLCN